MTIPHGSLTDRRTMKSLFMLCWISYVITYLGRLNYAACLVEIVNTEGWTKSQAGLIATGFFATYGIGQLVSGYIGDHLSPKVMVSFGLGVSGLINVLFPLMHLAPAATVLWCINGFVQSMIAPPLNRQLAEWMPPDQRQRACVNMNTTIPVGTLAVYGMSSALVFLGNWRLVFFTSGTLMIIMSAMWVLGISRIEKQVVPSEDSADWATDPTAPITGETPSVGKLVMASAMPLILVGLFMQGILKDGVTTWIPTFLEENFGLTAAAAILSTTVVPIVNLGGVYFASWMNRRYFHNEVRGASVFFAAALVVLGLLTFFPDNSAILSLLLLAAATTFMMAVNTILASMMPPYYVRYGACSTVIGLLNASAYLGSAVSNYGNGAIIEHCGWNSILYCWLACALFGAVACGLAAKKWKAFRSFHPLRS